MRERFIPFRKCDIKRRAAQSLPDSQRQDFERCADLIDQLYHAAFHQRQEQLKDLYSPHNPDRDTVILADAADSDADAFANVFGELLQRANFEPLASSDIQRALSEESLFRIKLHVDFEEFEDCLLYFRGAEQRRETLVQWFGLRHREVEFTNYARVALFLRFRSAQWFEQQQRPTDRAIPGGTLLKLFKDVPRADLEMLFPNTRVGMKTIDKLMIGVPAVASSAAVVFTKLGSTLLLVGAFLAFWLGLSDREVVIDQNALIALSIGMASLGGVLWREFNKFKNRKIRFMQTLSENLYFRNLDNNQGVIHRIVDNAEEEECKEAILGYFMLLQQNEGITEQALDETVEQWIRDQLGRDIDFEVKDSLRKLSALGLVRQHQDQWTATPLQPALVRLQELWQKVGHGDRSALTAL